MKEKPVTKADVDALLDQVNAKIREFNAAVDDRIFLVEDQHKGDQAA